MLKPLSSKTLTTLVLLSILSGSTALASTTPPDATESISPSNNTSTAANPYATIYTTDATAIVNAGGAAQTVYMGSGGAYGVSGGQIKVDVINSAASAGILANNQGGVNTVTGLKDVTVNYTTAAGGTDTFVCGIGAQSNGVNDVTMTGNISATGGEGRASGIWAASGGANTVNGLQGLIVTGGADASGIEAITGSTNKVTMAGGALRITATNGTGAGIASSGSGVNDVTLNGSLTVNGTKDTVGIITNRDNSVNTVKGLTDLTVIGGSGETNGFDADTGKAVNNVTMSGNISVTGADTVTGFHAKNGGVNTVTMQGGSLTVSGTGSSTTASGLYASGAGSGNTVTGLGSVQVTNTGSGNTAGIGTINQGSNMVTMNGDITVSGSLLVYGIEARRGSGATDQTGATVTVKGLKNIAVTSTGTNAKGGATDIYASNGCTTNVSMSGNASAKGSRAEAVLSEYGGTTTVTGLKDVTVAGTHWSSAILAYSTGSVANVTMSGSISATGSGSVEAISSRDGGTITVTGLKDVTADGTAWTSAIQAYNTGSVTNVTMSGTASATGPWPVTLEAEEGGLLNVTGPTLVKAVGADDTTNYLTYAVRAIDAGSVINLNMDGLISTQAGSYAAGVGALYGGVVNVNGNVKITAASAKGSSYAFALYADNGTVNVGTDGSTSLGKVVQVEGNLRSRNGGVINLTLDQSASYFRGKVYQEQSDIVNLTLANGGTWQLVPPSATDTGSNINNLNLQPGGIVDLTWDEHLRTGSYRDVSIDNLAGTGGIFKINTYLEQNTGDTISIGSASSATDAYIKVGYDPSNRAKLNNSYRVVTASPTGMSFNALPTEYGPRQFLPNLLNNGDGTWNMNGMAISPSRNTLTAGGVRQTLENSWLQHANSLSKRLGDLRLDGAEANGIWARYQRGTTKAGRGAAAELNANLFQVGYDKRFARKNGSTYWGLAVDHLNGSTAYENGSGKAKSTTVALYNTWVGDSGHYYDVILRQGHFDSEYGVVDTEGVYSHGDYGVNGTTLSGEYGYRKQLGGGSYLEPQAELILGRLGSADYTTSTGWPVHVDGMKHCITRLGVAAGRIGRQGSFYGRASYFHDFGGGGSISFDDYGYERTALRDWFELTVGGDVLLGKSARLYGEVTKYLGDVTNNLNFSAGVRWSF